MTKPSKNQLIIEAATALFSKLTYCKVSLRLIATHAGVSHSLVHKNYGTKEKLFELILKEQMIDFLRAFQIDCSNNQAAVSSTVLALIGKRNHVLLSLLQQVSANQELFELLKDTEVKEHLEKLLFSFKGVGLPSSPELDSDAFIMLLASVLFSAPASRFLLALGWDSGRVSTAQSNVMSGFMRLVYSLERDG